MLTKTNKTVTVPAGFYDYVEVVADASLLSKGTIVYEIAHVHTGSETKQGGCYNTKDTGRSWTCGGTVKWTPKQNIGSDESPNWVSKGKCSKCGASYQTHDFNKSGTTVCNNGKTYYLLDCGYEEGQVVATVSDISSLTANEKVLCAKISYE